MKVRYVIYVLLTKKRNRFYRLFYREFVTLKTSNNITKVLLYLMIHTKQSLTPCLINPNHLLNDQGCLICHFLFIHVNMYVMGYFNEII